MVASWAALRAGSEAVMVWSHGILESAMNPQLRQEAKPQQGVAHKYIV
jgi:hypothetical protein